MESLRQLGYLDEYFKNNIQIKQFMHENESRINAITVTNNILDFYAYVRILYDYSSYLINQGRYKKAIFYLDKIIAFFKQHINTFNLSLQKEKIYEFSVFYKAISLMKMNKIMESQKYFNELIRIDPDNDDYKEYKKTNNFSLLIKLSWPLYIISISIWTLGLIQNKLDKILIPQWSFDLAWFLWITGLIIQFVIPYFINRRLRII